MRRYRSRPELALLSVVEQVQAEFKVSAEFAHYGGPARLKAFLNLFYHQLLERGFWP